MVRRDLSRTVRPPPTRPPARGGTHTGTYAVPAGRTAARFSFKAVSGIGHRSENRLDGISFGTAYPPPRNGNGNTSGNTPKQNQIKKNSMSRKTQTPPRKALDRLTAAVTSILMLIPLAACSTWTPDPPAASSSPVSASAVGTRMVADADLPEYVVNGDFSYPGSPWGRNTAWNIWSDTGQYASVDASSPAGRIDGWDARRFGWTSTQTVGHAGVVELQNRSATGNIYVELAAYEPNTSIYQDIRTTPGTMLVWRLRHTSLNRSYLDRMSVMIGAPGHETAQQATRISVNGLGDKTGPVGTVIATPSGVDTYDEDTDPWWETYTGEYLVPAGQTVTRFKFLNVDSRSSTRGNLLDDIVLGRLYPLHYDGNGNTRGSTPEQKQ